MSSRLQQGLIHQKANRFAQAADCFRQVLKDQPEHPDALHFLGLALWNMTQLPEEPLKLLHRSMELAPDQPQMHHNIAAVLGSLGHIDQACDHYRKAIDLKPDYAEAYFNLGGVHKFSDKEPEIAAMQTMYAGAQAKLNDLDTEYLCFALSKAMNDTGRYHEAFHFALEAARIKNVSHNTAAEKSALADLRRSMTRKALEPIPGRGSASQAPVFIVGMPRSGTTLAEQILSRHSEVFAAGELPMIGSINDQMRNFAKQTFGYTGSIYGFLPNMPDAHFDSAAKACLDMIDKRADGQKFKRFTDKMPQNAFRLGLISMLFPKARIIHIKRHPLDTCVSCFFQRFRLGHEYSYRLDWLGEYYKFYINTMSRWRKVLPLPILEVRYEDMVQHPQTEAKRLVDFVGLEWQDACLKPQDAERSVMTASRWQVRQPIYRSSLERWRRYEPYLAPLIDALGGWSWIEKHTKS